MRAIELLTAAGVPTQVNCVVTAHNRGQLRELERFVRDRGARFKAEPVTRTGFARKIGDEQWESEFQVTRNDRVEAAEDADLVGFTPVCQSQVGYVAVSHHGWLKPCNMREGFFAPTGNVLVQQGRWWESFYGDTRLGDVVNHLKVPTVQERAELSESAGGYLCDLQLGVATAGHRGPLLTIGRRPAED